MSVLVSDEDCRGEILYATPLPPPTSALFKHQALLTHTHTQIHKTPNVCIFLL